MKYTITYKCGHKKEIDIFGKEEYREWKFNQLQSEAAEELCPDCKDKKAAEEAKEMGLLELEGSEKQVKWAENIRVEMLSDLSEHLEGYVAAIERQKVALDKRIALGDEKKIATAKEHLEKMQDGIKLVESYVAAVKTIASARWFIDHRIEGFFPRFRKEREVLLILGDEEEEAEFKSFIVSTLEEYAPKAEKTEESKELEADAEAEATLVPEGKEDAAIIEVRTSRDAVEIIGHLEYDDYKAVTAQDVGYIYDRGSRRIWHTVNSMTPPAEDVAAETICRLLRMGYRVLCYDAEARRMAQDGSYEPEERRWVYRLDGKIAIRVLDGRDEIHAKAIRGARWSHGSIVVPVSSWKEIEDFACIYGYRISDGAKEEIEKYKASTTSVTDIKDVVRKSGKDDLEKILESSSDVLDDLKDD